LYSETEAYEMGKKAALAGKCRLSGPFPTPYTEDKRPQDGTQLGAFWADGFDSADMDTLRRNTN